MELGASKLTAGNTGPVYNITNTNNGPVFNGNNIKLETNNSNSHHYNIIQALATNHI